MKKILLLSALQFVLSFSFAQVNREQGIQDSVIGWWKKLSIPQPKPPTKIQPLTIKQQDILVNFIKWMQQSYTPVGGIGTYRMKFYNSDKPSFSPFAYGINFRVWNVTFEPAYLESNGEFKPVSEEYTSFNVTANGIPGSYPIPFINTDKQYLFTWPPNGYNAANRVHVTSLSENANTGKYFTMVNEVNTVYIAPANKLPFIPVTKGELLQLAEDAVTGQLLYEKTDVENKWPGNVKVQQEVYESRKLKIEKYRVNIQKLRERHAATLGEAAVLRDMQPTIYSFEMNPDPFVITQIEQSRKQYFPVYKIDPSVMEKCKSDQPQWIAVNFPYETKEAGNQLYEMYRSLTEHFNYGYLQDYFFNPKFDKRIPYTAVNEQLLTATLNNYRKKAAPKTNAVAVALPAKVFFMDDFSGSTESSKPAGWFYSSYGNHSVTATIKNKPGKWLQLGYNNPVSPIEMKKPLPENFTLEYDLATDADFTSNTGGASSLVLTTRTSNANGSENVYNNGTKVKINISSGNESEYNNNNYRGDLSVKINSSPSLNTQNQSEGISFNYPLREFTNKKNMVHVAVKVKDNQLTVFLNDKPVAVSTDFKMVYGGACISCGVPAGTRFNAMFWDNTTNDADHVKVYISNVKITKE